MEKNNKRVNKVKGRGTKTQKVYLDHMGPLDFWAARGADAS